MKYTGTGAAFSPCGTFRYRLMRTWLSNRKGVVNFICLNPSTATAEEDDPTVRRCVSFAHKWGYGAVAVTNLFAARSTNPERLRELPDPIGPENGEYILRTARGSNLIVCAWGNGGRYKNRGMQVESMLRHAGITVHHLGMTRAFGTKRDNPQPKHPLYLRGDTKPMVWETLCLTSRF